MWRWTTVDPKIARLRAVPAFRGTSVARLRELAACGDELDVPDGAVLQHGCARHGVLVVTGTMVLRRGGTTIGELHPGQALSATSGTRRVYDDVTAVAHGDVRVLIFPPQLAHAVLVMLAAASPADPVSLRQPRPVLRTA